MQLLMPLLNELALDACKGLAVEQCQTTRSRLVSSSLTGVLMASLNANVVTSFLVSGPAWTVPLLNAMSSHNVQNTLGETFERT